MYTGSPQGSCACRKCYACHKTYTTTIEKQLEQWSYDYESTGIKYADRVRLVWRVLKTVWCSYRNFMEKLNLTRQMKTSWMSFLFFIFFLYLFFFILLIFFWQIASTWFYMTGFAHIYKMDFICHAINSYYNEMFCSLVIGLYSQDKKLKYSSR